VPQELHGLRELQADVVIGAASDPQHNPNIPFNPSIFSRQGNTDIGKGAQRQERSSFETVYRM